MGEPDPDRNPPLARIAKGEFLCGQVMAVQANFCFVDLDRPDSSAAVRVLCPRRTPRDANGLGIHVGDRVRVVGIDESGERGSITAIAPRRNLLERPAVANVSRVLVVVSLREPDLDPLQLTRFLITAAGMDLPVLLVFSKADLPPAALVRGWLGRAREWGYAVHAISTRTGEGLEALRKDLCQPGISVLCGPSGVGKSSLLKALRPDLDLRIGPVSGRLRRGRHTTRHVELFGLGDGGLVADTPGFNRPGLPVDPRSLARAFPELRGAEGAGTCRFRDCLHRGDPGCAFGTAWERYPLYHQCLEQVLADQGSGRCGGRVGKNGIATTLQRRSARRERQAMVDEIRIHPSQED